MNKNKSSRQYDICDAQGRLVKTTTGFYRAVKLLRDRGKDGKLFHLLTYEPTGSRVLAAYHYTASTGRIVKYES